MRKRQDQSGFALLLVLSMAAVLAIMLYMEVPRVAFEAQRDKEQLLIDRGEQYSRAIQLYVRKFNRYPPDFAALENTQNLRFLRRRYTDPMNPKKSDSDSDADAWRIVHVGPGGVFTDSLVYNVKKDGAAGSTPEKQTFITEMQQVGGNPTDPNQGQVSIAERRRQSDQPGAPGDPNNPNSAFPTVPGSDPTLNNSGQSPSTGYQIPPGVQFPGGASGMQSGSGGPLPGQMPPGLQLPPGVQIPGVNTPPGQSNGGPPSAAVNMINNLLTTPRPGGLAGLNGQPTTDQFGNPLPGMSANPQAAGPGGAPATTATIGTPAGQPMTQTIGGGIAGVASKTKQDGIKIYKDQKTYNKWEFVYDITKDTTRAGGAAAQIPQAQPPGTPVPPMGTSPAPGAVPGVNPGMNPGMTPGATPPAATPSPTTP